ncbi:MAG: hypothetical protein ACRD2H_06185 [Terriglobales bacterium]
MERAWYSASLAAFRTEFEHRPEQRRAWEAEMEILRAATADLDGALLQLIAVPARRCPG